jgi:hypothetical protein
MKKIALLTAAAASALAFAAAPAQAGIATIQHCDDGLFGNPESIRETRDCIVDNAAALPGEIVACTDGFGGSPETIGDTRDCVVRELTD